MIRPIRRLRRVVHARRRLAAVPLVAKDAIGTCALSASATTSVIPNDAFTVSTYRRRRLPTLTEAHRVPLSLVDIHLRHEQLPFCYFFRETLDEVALEESLRVVLQDFPQTGGRICPSHLAIQCEADDVVSLSFGRINTTLDEWQSQQRGHLHQSQSTLSLSCSPSCSASQSEQASQRKPQHPVLLPLFDALFANDQDTSLLKIKVTYFDCGGTALGVNANHALGDTASCVHFVQSWGKHMRSKQYKIACTDRSKASLSGMMSPDLADAMGLGVASTATSLSPDNSSMLSDFLQDWFPTTTLAEDGASRSKSVDAEPSISDESSANVIRHEYVRLAFPPELLHRLKDMGKVSCHQDSADDASASSFVSTNDMVTAFGWMMKRHLSKQWDYNISMVINLRGRSDVKQTLFGNGITHVVASMPPSTPFAFEKNGDETRKVGFSKHTLCQAAKAIREALQFGFKELPDALVQSRMGRATPAPSNSTKSFSTTSWGQFPLYRVRFGLEKLADFHGHPSHPLPPGRTFSSVITPRSDGGVWYEMFVPSDQASRTRRLHGEMVDMCMK